MSLVFFESRYISQEETYSLVKEKTGLEITEIESVDSYVSKYSVKFPDMDTPQELLLCPTEGTFSYGICFVDTESHFFSYIEKMDKSNYGAKKSMNKWMKIMIFEVNEKLHSAFNSRDTTSDSLSGLTNIGYYVKDSTKDRITIYPLFFSCDSSVPVPSAYIKNMFINCERMFEPGLRFIDENNNEFITLGGYLLYYNGKHK